MKIELRPIDETNREDCIRLKVAKSQADYIATNKESLEAAAENAEVARPFVIYAGDVPVGFTMFAFDPDYEDPNNGQAFPFGIYDDDTPVGFCMIGYGADDDWEDAPSIAKDNYDIWRFMIDEECQGQGLGREALKQIIAYFKENGATNMRLSTKESNVNAIHLYESQGFKRTGEMNDEETVFELNW